MSVPRPTVVVARYKEKLDWLDDFNLDNFDVLIYTKCDQPSECSPHQCINLPNVGLECHTYLTYIVNHYHNLPPVVLFTLAGLSKNAGPFHQSKYDKFQYIYAHYDNALNEGCITKDKAHAYEPKFKKSTHRHTSFANKCTDSSLTPAKVRPFGAWYRTYIDPDERRIARIGVSHNAIFAVSASAIRKHTLDFYNELLEQTTHGKNVEVAHYMERTWLSMFKE